MKYLLSSLFFLIGFNNIVSQTTPDPIPDHCNPNVMVEFPRNHLVQSELPLHPGGDTGYDLTGIGPDGLPYVFLHSEGGSHSCFRNNPINVERLNNNFDNCSGDQSISFTQCPESWDPNTGLNDIHSYRCNLQINGSHHFTTTTPSGWYRGTAPGAEGIIHVGLGLPDFNNYLNDNPRLILTYNTTAGSPGQYASHQNNDPSFLFFGPTCNRSNFSLPSNNYGDIQLCGWNDNTQTPTLNANKNVSIIGTVGSQGLWGPQVGGLLKPDFVCRPSGSSASVSSYATPKAAGIALLLREQWHKQNPQNNAPHSSTIRAIMTHTTDAVAGYNIPSYEKGWGLINGVRAAELIDKHFNCETAFIEEVQFTSNGSSNWNTDFYYDGNSPLKATIVWHEQLQLGAFGLTDCHIVENDFNLTVTRLTDNQETYPLVLNPASPSSPASSQVGVTDDINNVEQVLIEFPSAGYYRINVSGPSSLFLNEDQVVSVVVDGMAPVVEGISFALNVCLEGPALTGTNSLMSSSLSQNNELPLSQPYDDSPYFYSGCEVLNTTATNIVDWLLVELRLADDFDVLVDQRAVLLRNDGVVLNPNGSPGVIFPNAVEDVSYSVVIRHRNHLDVISNSPVTSPCVSAYDFTISEAMAAPGQNQLKPLGPKYAMIGGDFDGNSINNIIDFNIWQEQLTLLGYYSADVNLDGNVNILDFQIWHANNVAVGLTDHNSPGINCSTAGCELSVLDESRFNNGWDSWNDGGNHCWRSSGLKKAVIRRWGRFTSDPLDLSTNTDVEISFDLQALNMDVQTDDLFLEISLNGGSSYSVLNNLKYGIDFQNSQIAAFTYSVPGPYSDNVVFRFRSHNNANNEHFRIDNIVVAGCDDGSSSKTEVTDNNAIEARTVTEASIKVLYDYGNIWFQCQDLSTNEPVEYKVYDLNGRMLHKSTSDLKTWQLNAPTIDKGVYILVSTCGSEKFIVRQ